MTQSLNVSAKTILAQHQHMSCALKNMERKGDLQDLTGPSRFVALGSSPITEK